MSKLFNPNPTRITTYSKVISLLFTVTIAFIILFAVLVYYNFKLEKESYKAASDQLEREVNSLLDLNSTSYLTLINDYETT